MYSIIQKIYEKNNKILKEGLEKVLKGEDISSLTTAISDFTNKLGQELFSEIVKQIDELIYEDSKRKTQYESVKYGERKYITQNGKTKFERRYYADKETGEHVYLADKILGIGAEGIVYFSYAMSIGSLIATLYTKILSKYNTSDLKKYMCTSILWIASL